MSISDFVATLLDDLTEVSESTNRQGLQNWKNLGAADSCWRCAGTFGTDIESGSQAVHHIIPTSEGGPDSKDNRSLLCSNCHAVIHRYYLPTNRIGAAHTRSGDERNVAKFEAGVTISQLLPSPDFKLGRCYECKSQGTVTGVSEGYWNGEGLLVLLSCGACGAHFAVPFIGTTVTPKIDPISALILAMGSAAGSASQDLPADLILREKKWVSAMRDILLGLRKEERAAERNSRRAGASDADLRTRLAAIREGYVEQLRQLLPEAKALQEAIEEFRLTKS